VSGFHPDRIGALDWVLILAPYRRDASYMASLLDEHGIRAQAASAADLTEQLAKSPGVLVVTHEALSQDVIATIAEFLQDQPNWSEIPIVVLLDRTASQSRIKAALSEAWLRSRQTFYQRPVAALELVSGIQSALLTRFRQRELRDYLDRELELRLELNHRVKNILASVMSIFEMTRRGAGTMDSLAADFRGRLTALSNIHSAVFNAGGQEVSLVDVVNSTLAPYRSDGSGRFRVDGPDVAVSGEAGTTLALCFHELATNAIKYGALSSPKGQIVLHWELSAGPEPDLTIVWAETGGPAVVAPSPAGYGTRYMRSALAGLFGKPPEFVFATSGLRCTMHGPLSRVSLKP
jgi:two-component sensor histidine kinase